MGTIAREKRNMGNCSSEIDGAPQPKTFPVAADDTLTDEWFKQWTQTDAYVASDGTPNRIPLRLQSTNAVVYGGADLAAVKEEFEHEAWQPVTVAGKVPVQIWFNNFTDTDCGPANRVNPYYETWYSFPVTSKSTAAVDLPEESPFSWNAQEPTAKVWVHRVLCAPKGEDKVGALAAISGGREIWGFPKHPAPAAVTCGEDDKTFNFDVAYQTKKVITLKMKLPEATEGFVPVPVDLTELPKDLCFTPKQSPTTPGFVPKQTNYGQAFASTMNLSPWDAAT